MRMEHVVLVVGLFAVLAAWDGWRRYLLRATSLEERFAGVDRAIAAVAEKTGEARTLAARAEDAITRVKNHLESLKTSPVRRIGR